MGGEIITYDIVKNGEGSKIVKNFLTLYMYGYLMEHAKACFSPFYLNACINFNLLVS